MFKKLRVVELKIVASLYAFLYPLREGEGSNRKEKKWFIGNYDPFNILRSYSGVRESPSE